MPTSTVCVDASLVVRLLLDPQDEAVTSLWRSWFERGQGVQLVAPALITYEVTTALYQQQRQQRVSADGVESLLVAMIALPIRTVTDTEINVAAYRLATRFGLPATYDAHYLATAEKFDAEFWTADRKLATAVQNELPWVKMIESV